MPFPSPGDLPDGGIKPESQQILHWQAGSFPLSYLGSAAVVQSLRCIRLLWQQYSSTDLPILSVIFKVTVPFIKSFREYKVAQQEN